MGVLRIPDGSPAALQLQVAAPAAAGAVPVELALGLPLAAASPSACTLDELATAPLKMKSSPQVLEVVPRSQGSLLALDTAVLQAGPRVPRSTPTVLRTRSPHATEGLLAARLDVQPARCEDAAEVVHVEHSQTSTVSTEHV